MRFRSLWLFFVAVAASFFCHSVAAQDYIYDAGSPAYGVNIPVENGFINVTNGNLHMEFHLATHPQRGALQLDEKLVYDSRFWKIGKYSRYHWWPDNLPRTTQMGLGWRFVTGAETGTLQVSPQLNQTPCYGRGEGYSYDTNYSYTWQDPGGTAHVFSPNFHTYTSDCSDYHDPNPESTAAPAADSSGYILTATGDDQNGPSNVTIKNVSGTQVYPSVIDRYGNFWSADQNGNLVDDRGQTPVIVTSSGNQIYYDVLVTGGGRARYTVTTASYPIHTYFNQPAVEEYNNGPLNGIQSIQLPDGSSYSFSYELFYGELSSVTLPTGGVVHYSWLTYFDSYNNANRWISTRQLGSDPTMTFTPNTVTRCTSSGPGCQEKVTVREPGGDEAVYNMTLNNGAWNTSTLKYDGLSASGTLKTTTETTYDFSQPCSAGCTGSQYITAQNVTTTLNDINMKVSDVYAYSDQTLGLLQSKAKYDFYSGSLPSKATLINEYGYGSTVPGDITATATRDGDGNILSFETRTYGPPAVTTSGLVGHGTANAAGTFLNSVSKLARTNNSGNIYDVQLKTTYTWDDAGTLRSESTPYTGSVPTGYKTYTTFDSTGTFPTAWTDPAVPSNVTLAASSVPDPTTGALTSSTDYNGRVATYKSYDSFNRIGEVDSPDNLGVTTYEYSPTSKITRTRINSTQTATLVEAVDAFGRPNRTATANGQAATPWYQQDTCYDSSGRVQYTSTPYAGTGFNMPVSCSGTYYTYDYMGRPKSITNSDGTTTFDYKGRSTLVTDVNGQQKITQKDGLGRVTIVCELSSETNMPGGETPQACNTDYPGTGFVTTYAYNLWAYKTTITQGSQTRMFISDSLGRDRFSAEPEGQNITTITAITAPACRWFAVAKAQTI